MSQPSPAPYVTTRTPAGRGVGRYARNHRVGSVSNQDFARTREGAESVVEGIDGAVEIQMIRFDARDDANARVVAQERPVRFVGLDHANTAGARVAARHRARNTKHAGADREARVDARAVQRARRHRRRGGLSM